MYPKAYLDLFPAFPRDNTVFVAMPFDKAFAARYEQVIDPAIRSGGPDGVPLEPIRADIRRVGDSIVTQILEGISRSALVLADVSTVAKTKDGPFRNANVLYEVGLAQAVRLPEEIILFRSDSDPLLFDISSIRVNHFDPENDPAGARRLIGETIIDAFAEMDLTKHRAIENAAAALDWESFTVLVTAGSPKGFTHPNLRTMRDVMSNVQRYGALERLLDAGAVKAEYPRIDADEARATPNKPAPVLYRATPFGNAVVKLVVKRMGGDDPRVTSLAVEMFGDE